MGDNPNETQVTPDLEDKGEGENLINQMEDGDLKQVALTEIARKKHFRTKFHSEEELRKKAEEDLETYKKDNPAEKTEKTETTQTPTAPPEKKVLDAKAFAVLLHKGYTSEDIEFVETVMQSTEKTAKEVMEMDYVKNALEAAKTKRESQQETPPPSDKVSSMSIGDKAYKDLSDEEKKSNFSYEGWKKKKAGN